MKALPTLRRKIFQSFSFVVALYAILGVLLVISVIASTRTTPKMLHLNYDSISAAKKMDLAWTGLRFSEFAHGSSAANLKNTFEASLQFELGNVTEPGEALTAKEIDKIWQASLGGLKSVAPVDFLRMHELLQNLVTINEAGMFKLARENQILGNRIEIAALVYFLLSLIACLFFADNFSQRLSRPLKSITEALHSRQDFSRRLKLPEPSTLELLILTTELERLWARVGESEKINIIQVLEEKNKLETLLSSVEDALLVLSPDGTVSHCNELLALLIGLPANLINGQVWRDLSTHHGNYILLRSVLRPEMQEAQQVDLEFNQATAYFSARSRKLQTGGFLYLLHNVTEKKQREKFRTEFIDLLSHELKTPLQSLGTASELLTQQKLSLPVDLQLLVETIAEDVDRIRAVAHEFVQITQSQSKIMKLKLDLMAISELLPEWLKPFQVVARDRNVKIEYSQAGDSVIWANLDLVKFPWVISNILSNAIRFSPRNESVFLRLSENNGSIVIQIRDAGPGISTDDQLHMFEAFFQANWPNSGASRGLFGIGLTIAKEVVEAHDGRITYAKIEPHGSEFSIILPEAKSWKN